MKNTNSTAKNTLMAISAVVRFPLPHITLRNATDAARTLVDVSVVRTLLVATDDEGWLAEQKSDLHLTDPSWRVINEEAPWLTGFDVTDLSAPSSASHAIGKHTSSSYNETEARERFAKYGRHGLLAGVHSF